MKHDVRVHVVNLYTDELGNPEAGKIPAGKRKGTNGAVGSRSRRETGCAITRMDHRSCDRCCCRRCRRILHFLTSNWLESAACCNRAGTGSDSGKIDRGAPFENLSHDTDNAYFADGIQDEILTRLAKIADLKVISRTSTQHYESAPDNLREIAKQLGVAHVLEGSVQKSGDAVRVNVQLIKAANDSHLWADTFDRKLTDIFSVESEVAKAIADQLRAKLTGQEEQVIAAKPTDNAEAYDAYLRGLAYRLKTGYTPANALGAQKYLKEAVRLDPKFALAWALLSYTDALGYITANLQPTSHCVKRHGRQPKPRSLFSPILARRCGQGLILLRLPKRLRHCGALL